jgi:hypothetical protein
VLRFVFSRRSIFEIVGWQSHRYSSAAEMWNGSALSPPTGSTNDFTIRSVGNWHRSKPLAPGRAAR